MASSRESTNLAVLTYFSPYDEGDVISLEVRNIPTPGTINYQRYGNLQGYCPQAPCNWVYQSVSAILERKEYLGHTVNFKTTPKSYKSKKVIINVDDQRKVFEDPHPAIINQDTFDRVQILWSAVL